jgi:hypothetical protein
VISLIKVRLTDLLAYYRNIRYAHSIHDPIKQLLVCYPLASVVIPSSDEGGYRSGYGHMGGWYLGSWANRGRPRRVCVAGAPSPLEESIICLLTAITMASINRQLATCFDRKKAASF